MDMMAYLDALLKKGVMYREQESMALHTTFCAGGTARLTVFPSTREQLMTALTAPSYGVPMTVLGNGSNVLFRDGGYDGAVVITTGVRDVTFSSPDADGVVRVTAACGASLTGLAAKCQKKGLSGLEFAYGIPGTVGGAVYMNAGAYGGEMADVLTESRHYDTETGVVGEWRADEHHFDYRFSHYMACPHKTVLDVTLSLKQDDPAAILDRMTQHMEARKSKQPLEYPSAGSTFKRPEGRFVGQMTEECGLKGYTVGGARLSEKHGGFVINCGGATASDILAVMEHIEAVIYDTYGVNLEREVQILGEDK